MCVCVCGRVSVCTFWCWHVCWHIHLDHDDMSFNIIHTNTDTFARIHMLLFICMAYKTKWKQRVAHDDNHVKWESARKLIHVIYIRCHFVITVLAETCFVMLLLLLHGKCTTAHIYIHLLYVCGCVVYDECQPSGWFRWYARIESKENNFPAPSTLLETGNYTHQFIYLYAIQ